MPRPNRNLKLSVPDDLKQRLEAQASGSGRSLTQYVQHLLETASAAQPVVAPPPVLKRTFHLTAWLRRGLIVLAGSLMIYTFTQFQSYIEKGNEFSKAIELYGLDQEAFFEEHGMGPERSGRRFTAKEQEDYTAGLQGLIKRGVENRYAANEITRRGRMLVFLVWGSAIAGVLATAALIDEFRAGKSVQRGDED